MRLDEPAWWYSREPSLIVRALRPLSALYAWAVQRRFHRAQPYRSRLPVFCIGNLVAGGTGKTPLTIVIANELKRLGEQPAILTRGYGGSTTGPHWVDAVSDTAAHVGDEALLLAEHAPTLVARDRKAGARAIENASAGYTVIVMDDGLQNPALVKDLSIAVVDARRGIGNGKVLPAGPLRAPLAFQLNLIEAVLVNHPPGSVNTGSDIAAWLHQNFPGSVLEAQPQADADASWVKGSKLVAFAGIANPQRFFNLLTELGGEIAETVVLPDHHAFSDRDAERILTLAATHDAIPVTTEKDRVRLRGTSSRRGALWQECRSVGIELVLADRDHSRLTALISAALTTHPIKR